MIQSQRQSNALSTIHSVGLFDGGDEDHEHDDGDGKLVFFVANFLSLTARVLFEEMSTSSEEEEEEEDEDHLGGFEVRELRDASVERMCSCVCELLGAAVWR